MNAYLKAGIITLVFGVFATGVVSLYYATRRPVSFTTEDSTMFLCYGQNERCVTDACDPGLPKGIRDREFYSVEAWCPTAAELTDCYHSKEGCEKANGSCRLVTRGRATPNLGCRPNCKAVAAHIVEVVLGSNEFLDAGVDIQENAIAMKDQHIDNIASECEKNEISREAEACIMAAGTMDQLMKCQ